MSAEPLVIHTPKQLAILNKFRRRLDREKYVNNYASNYYGTLQSKFTIPGILITGISSIASFMATSDMLTNETKAGFLVGVGILTAGATILQSVSSSFGFGVRKEAFQKSADAYDDLITKIEFELYNPNEPFMVFCNGLEEAILKIKNDCNFLPPLFVMAKYEAELKKTQLKLDSEGSPSKDGSIFGDTVCTGSLAQCQGLGTGDSLNFSSPGTVINMSDTVCAGLLTQCNVNDKLNNFPSTTTGVIHPATSSIVEPSGKITSVPHAVPLHWVGNPMHTEPLISSPDSQHSEA